MCAWIEGHQALRSHPKTLKLAMLLGVNEATAVGSMMFLWWWALDYAEDGNLSRFDDLEIAIAGGWKGDPAAFVNALVKSRFVDAGADGYMIHDWEDYAGRLLDRRRKNAARARKFRAGTGADAAPKQKTEKTTKPKSKGTPHMIPEDFHITDRMREWSREQKFPDDWVDQLTREFIAHWSSKGEKRIDWPQTWRGWLEREARWKREREAAKAARANGQQYQDSREEIRAIAEGRA